MDTYYHLKKNVQTKEYRIYKYLENLDLPFVPKLYSYDKKTQTLKTQKINGLNLSDLYGEKWENIPDNIMEKVRDIITKLYEIGIIYPDITGYNFIQDHQSKIWVVDFEHCFYFNNYNINPIETTIEDKEQQSHIEFVIQFCFENIQSWNPHFA
jgi:tRNA A-37 threonylcarbamoyl transferase component Bud32